jgi:ribonuclease Z
MNFRVLILGSNSAIPAFGRNPSAQYIQHFADAFLVDCGEGTQIRLSNFRVKRGKIRAIFISHLHGDHIFGLPGLLTTFSLSGFENEIHIIGPIGLKRFIETNLEISQSTLRFPIHIRELEENYSGIVYETSKLEVRTFPLNHRIATFGYCFQEKQKPLRLRGEHLEQYKLVPEKIHAIRSGADLQLPNGLVIPNSELTLPPHPSYSYAYCSDTLYDESLLNYIEHIDVLYHEATFGKDMKDLAKERYHSTSVEAAQIALLAKVKTLYLGHFSSRYQELEPLLEEAKTVFKDSHLAIEGQWIDIDQ